MTDVSTRDHVIDRLRDEIADVDRRLVATINARLALVKKMRKYKEERGIPFLDPAREEWMLQYLKRANTGPLLVRRPCRAVRACPRSDERGARA